MVAGDCIVPAQTLPCWWGVLQAGLPGTALVICSGTLRGVGEQCRIGSSHVGNHREWFGHAPHGHPGIRRSPGGERLVDGRDSDRRASDPRDGSYLDRLLQHGTCRREA